MQGGSGTIHREQDPNTSLAPKLSRHQDGSQRVLNDTTRHRTKSDVAVRTTALGPNYRKVVVLRFVYNYR